MPAKYPDRTQSEDDWTATWNIADMVYPWLVVSSLPSDTPERKLAILSLVQSDFLPATAVAGRRILVSEYVVHPVVFRHPLDAPPSVARRVVFPQPDTLPVGFVSEAVIRSLAGLATDSGRMPPWYPPLEVQVKSRRTSKGRRRWELILVR